MSLPTTIVQHIYDHYQAADWGLITLDANNKIIEINQKASQDLDVTLDCPRLQDVLPLVATESLNESFFLPFYNHQDKVFDVHFITTDEHKYLILVPVDMLHEQVQVKQQIAHEEEIEKLRIKYLLTALRTAHEELDAANAAKSFYISALSHEMGNPLNAIKGYNDLLAEAAINVKQATTVINKNVAKLQHIINQTLDYDNQQNKKSSAQCKPKGLVDDIFNDFKIQATAKTLKLKNQVSPRVTLNCNPTKLNQILTNLISNAIKYTDQGSVTVQSNSANGYLHLDVIDSGCGISPTFQKQLFKAWSREQKSAAEGNGIGLVIAKMMAEQMAANLVLYHSDSSGSVFRLSFEMPDLKNHLILLVDDDVDCLNLFTFYLTQAGHQVDTAQSVEDMLARLKRTEYDALVTDLNLPDGRPDQVFEQIKKAVNTKVIMTANPSRQRVQHLTDLGFDRVLCKPLNQEELVNSVS